MTGKVKNKNKKKSQAAAVWRRLKKNKMAVLGLIILAVIIFFAVFADVFFDYETLVIQQNASLKLQPPSVEHWLGTDEVGRDILARIVHGARISLPVAFATIAIATVVGGLLGAIAGYGSRRVDDVIMRVMDIFLAIPSILLSIALVSAMGTSVTNMMLAISISNIPPFARIVRSAVLTISTRSTSRRPAPSAPATSASSSSTSCPTAWPPSLCRPRCLSPGPSWLSPASASSAWASARPRRSGVLWSAPAGSISGRPGGCARSRALPSC